MTTEDTTIDFSEDGRLLALRTLCGDLEDDSAMSDSVSVMHVRSRLEYITEELGHVVAAYREAVLAAESVLMGMRHKHDEEFAQVPWKRLERLVDALARFRNITEEQS